MPTATILGFPIEGTAQPARLPDRLQEAFAAPPSRESLDEIEETERQNRLNAAEFFRRNPIIR